MLHSLDKMVSVYIRCCFKGIMIADMESPVSSTYMYVCIVGVHVENFLFDR